ncbi:MAG: ParB/RepB/Spo0J family partition protein [Treponema sp.]|nr:ParB/RepB/Spo0J family partition protein [Treponema sp.]
MAKNALGKGLGALLSENQAAKEEVEVSLGGGIHNVKVTSARKSDNIPDIIEVDENGGLWLDPALLKPNPKQPRTEFKQKELEELCASIKENGILQPIVIEQAGENEFYIIAGERRTRASKMAGLTKVPVVLRKFDEQQKLEMALIENIQRSDLNPIEEATAYYNLIQMGDLTQDEVAKKVGKNRSTVANAIRLLKLPEDIQKALINGQLSSGHARALLSVKTDSDMRVLFGKIIGSGLSVREAEAMAEQYNNGGRASPKKKSKSSNKKDPDIALFEQKLKNLFGVRDVNFKGTIDKGSIEIGFSSKNDFDRIYDVLIGQDDD